MSVYKAKAKSKRNKKQLRKAVKLFLPFLGIAILFLLGYAFFKYFKISSILASTQNSISYTSDSDFGKGQANQVQMSGSGEAAELQIEGGTGPDNTIYKRNIVINNTQNDNTLEEYQVMVDLDTSSLISSGKMQSDCADLRFTNSSGDELSYYTLAGTCNTADTKVWVKVDEIGASSDTDIEMYYGSPSAEAKSSEADVFSYSSEKTVAYMMDNSVSSLDIVSLEDGNSVTHNGVTRDLTNEMDTSTFSSLQNYGAVKAKKLFEAQNPTASDMLVPVSWAGKEFILSNRNTTYTMNLAMLSPWGDATVKVYVNGSQCGGDITVNDSGHEVTSCGGGAYNVVRVVSDIPILLDKIDSSGAGNDPMPIRPASLGPWYGFDSSEYLVKSGPDGADYRWIDSSRAAEVNPSNLGANSYADVSSSGGTYYGGATVRTWSQDHPIGVQTYADSDGGDATTHMLATDFGTKFGSPYSTDFVAIVSDQAATCSVYNSSGNLVDTQTLTSSNGLVYGLPGSVFGRGNSSTYLSGKWELKCDKPVMVVSQETDDEQNMFTYPMMRQFTYPTPTVSTGDEAYALPSSGTWESDDSSNAIDLIWNGGWGDGTDSSTAFSATVGSVGASSSVTFQIRAAATTSALSSATYKTLGIASSGTEFVATAAQVNALNLPAGTDGRYVQIKATFTSTDGITNPELKDFTLNYQKDNTGPEIDASGISMKASSSGADIAAGDWDKSNDPYFSWNAGSDSQSGLKGYCLYLGTDPTADPATAKGILGTSPVSTDGTDCQFIVSEADIDFATASYQGDSWLTSSSEPYYFKVKAIDNQDNVYDAGNAASFSFKYDDTAPSNPGGLSAPQNFQNSVDAFVIYWPTTGAAGPADADSGIKGYQYRIGASGTWYGANHAGDGDCNDVITDGTYVLDDNFDTITQGENTFYLRTIDNACNVSNTAVTAILKYSGNAPSEPQSLAVDPSEADNNSFSFSWDAPLTYSGQASGIKYCYTVNTTPTALSCNWTSATSLEAGPYASTPGTNTFYVVAKDEAGNINYSAYSEIDFNCDTAAPGIARSLDVSDISIKASSNWKLAVSWEEPENTGAGVESYEVYRSTSASSCSDNFSAFSLAGSTAGTSYTDTNLEQKTYHYCVKACDSANNCSAVSSTASGYPDGKFTEPATLTSDPKVNSITTKQATINWSTDRVSDSKVAYGKGSSDFYNEEPSNSDQTTSHEITLTSLDPGTRYYYKVKWTDGDGNTGESKTQSFETDPAPSVASVNVSSAGIDSALIDFKLKDASKATIVYGESTAYGGTISTASLTGDSTYSARIAGLKDGTQYHYKIILEDSEGDKYEFEDHVFTTLPRPHISNVRVQQVKNSAQPSILVSWDTNTEISSIITYYPENDSSGSKDKVDTKMTKGSHEMLVEDLKPQMPYLLVVKGTDKAGNEATSDSQKFTTASDTRPPVISNLSVEGSNAKQTKNSQSSSSQVVVSWNTDEAATSQVEFGEGSGSTYSQKTQEDSNLTYNHLVVISGLTPSKVYHLRAVSKDSAGNEADSIDTATITPKAVDNALDLVVGNLRSIFGM